MPEQDAQREWRERQLKVARYVQSRAIEAMSKATPSQLAALQRAQRQAAELERRLIAAEHPPPTLAELVEANYRRWLRRDEE